MAQQPYIKFFGTDWRSDPALRMCSPAARGTWVDIMTLMMEAEPFGYLLINGKPATVAQIAALTCTPPATVTKALTELRENGVSHAVGDADHPEDIRGMLRADLPPETIFSRRLIRDRWKSDKGKADGAKGGNPRLKGSGKPPVNDNGITGEDKGGGYGDGITPPVNTHSHSHSQSQNPEEESPADAGSARYAFEGKVVRVNFRDFKQWQSTFTGIPDLKAELMALDTFYSELPEKDRKNWFIRCSTALNNKHQEHLARRPLKPTEKPRPQASELFLDPKY